MLLHERYGRDRCREVGYTITAVVILGWQLTAGGSIGANILARSLASPVVVLLPPVLAFTLALGFVATLPPILRALARRARTAPMPVRLSLLSVSREPARPAATLTLLAFSLGAIVFAAGWSASLNRGIEDAAAGGQTGRVLVGRQALQVGDSQLGELGDHPLAGKPHPHLSLAPRRLAAPPSRPAGRGSRR